MSYKSSLLPGQILWRKLFPAFPTCSTLGESTSPNEHPADAHVDGAATDSGQSPDRSIKSARSFFPILPEYNDLLLKNCEYDINGTPLTLRHFTILLLSSFDPIEHTIYYEKALDDHRYYTSGQWKIQHASPFMGWVPAENNHRAITLPYGAYFSTDASKLRSLRMVSPYVRCLLESGMPPKLLPVLQNLESVRMLCALRGIGVRPEVITYNALLGAAHKPATWGQALGIA